MKVETKDAQSEAEGRTGRDGNPAASKVLDIIDDKRSRYAVAVAVAEYIAARDRELLEKVEEITQRDFVHDGSSQAFDDGRKYEQFLNKQALIALRELIKELKDAKA